MTVTRFELTSRKLAGNGISFGRIGQYEFIRGIIHYEIDPKHPDSQLVTDIDMAPRESNGKVRFTSDVHILRPLNPSPGGSLLLSVPNRGGRSSMSLNDPRPVATTEDPDLGNGFLMRYGFTVVFCGWQTDVPTGGIRLHVPEALDDHGQRLIGQTYQQYDVSNNTHELLLADRQHNPLPAADLQDATAILIQRDWPDGPPTVIPREDWLFARWVDGRPIPDANYVCFRSGFQSGRTYEIIYTTIGASLIGLGLLAVRDCGSFMRYGTAEQGNMCAGKLDRAYAHGTSQTGRFLREFTYLGFNLDEAGRLVFDGLMPHTASSRFGEFNIRFGQPSSNHLRNVGNMLPLTYSGATDDLEVHGHGLLRRLVDNGAVPKIIATNSSVEHWWSDAALTHIDTAGVRDLEPPNNVRIYAMAGTRHGPGSLPLTSSIGNGLRQQHLSNTLDYEPILRAALHNLDLWVREGTPPPPSRIPKISDGTAVSRESLEPVFRSIPGMGFPKALPIRRGLDYGHGMANGIPAYPAKEGEAYVTLVSGVDEDGNEVAGIRLPDISVPLGTHTGWTMRHSDIGGVGHFMPLQGSVVPFHRTMDEREAAGDPRPSIEERYSSKNDYLEMVRRSADGLVTERYILLEDVERIVVAAGQRWDAFQAFGPSARMDL